MHQLPQHHPARLLPTAGTTGSPGSRSGPKLELASSSRRVPPWDRRLPLRRRRAAVGPAARAPRSSRSPTWRSLRPSPTRRPGTPASPAAGRGHSGCRWGGWPPTRRTSRPSPPCSWPGPRRDPTPASRWWAHRPSRPTRRARRATPPRSGWPTPSTSSVGHQRRRAGRPLPGRRRAGHALRPRGLRRAAGRGHGPGAPDRGLRRRRRGRGPR